MKRGRVSGISVLAITILLATVIVWLGVFPPAHSRITMNQIRAANSMNELVMAERIYAASNPQVGFTCELGRLIEARPATTTEPALIDRVLATGEKAGYRFALSSCNSDLSGKVIGYSATAIPMNPELGKRAFCADERGVVWFADSGAVMDCFQRKSPSTPNK